MYMYCEHLDDVPSFHQLLVVLVPQTLEDI